jgi:hypothetical protein
VLPVRHTLPANVRIHVASEGVILWDFVVSILASSSVRRLSAAIVAVAALAVIWQGLRWSSPNGPRDFEECVDQAQNAPEGRQRAALITDCGARFAGRRKPDGGYTYYDFLQNRSFDIAGPNPTEEERRRIDLEYMSFLDSERREAVSAELAKSRIENLTANFENVRGPIGLPTILTPKNLPAPTAKSLSDRSKSTRCTLKDSLSCSWARITSAVKDALASASKPGPN